MPKRKPSGTEGDIWFSGHINEQTACEAGSKALKARVCELMEGACLHAHDERRMTIMNAVHDTIYASAIYKAFRNRLINY